MNKINILDDSIQLYSFAGTEKEILKTFGKKQITYKIENNNIKVFAYNDYFYRGCLWSSDIPLIINDEEYSSIDDIITKLDEWFYSPNEGGGGDIDIDPSLSPTSKNPVANSAITNAINSLPSMTDVNSAITNATSGLASTEWVEEQHYLTEHQPLKTINDQVISGTGNITISADTSNFYSKQETDALLDDKMDVSGMTDYSTKSWVQNQGYLTEHTPLKTINDQVISGTGNIVITAETVDAYTKAETDALLDDKMDVSGMTDYSTKEWVQNQHYLTEHQPLKTINGETISGTGDIVITAETVDAYTKEETNALLDDKQDVLSAGTGINISGNVISVTLDTDLFVIVQELPQTGDENKFYLVPTENSGSSNVYAEYIYTNNAWEKIGEEVVDVDLTPYLKKTDAAATYLSKTDAASTYATKSELDDFYSKSETDALLDDKADAADIADMATTGWVESQGYLTEHTPLKTINNQVISGTGNIDIPVFQLRWVADGDNYICDMVTHTKYQQDKQQVTFDGGGYYMDIGNVRRGEVIETESVDCGADPSTKYKAKVLGLDGKTSYIPKNGSSVLTRGETIPWSSSTVGYMSGSMKEIEIYSAVTEIGQDAFFEYGQLTSITMPNTITTIGQSALAGLNRIENIEIPSSVTSIGTAAFEGNVKMSGLTISNIQQIPTRMCYGCSGLTSFTIPDLVLSVGDGAFSGCSMMTSLTIGSGLTSFGASSMAGCSNLVTISAYTTSAPSIGSYNFHGVHTNGTLYIPNSDEETFSNWMRTNQYYLGYYGWTIHKTNRWVADGDEFICSGSSGYDKYQQEKQQVSYNDGQTWQDVSPAVYQCGELIEANSEDCGADPSVYNKAKLIMNGGTRVYIPKNQSTELTNAEVAPYSADTVSAIVYSGVTSIGNSAFTNCDLTSITISNGVTSIGNNAFYYQSNLTSITIPDSVTSIGMSAFGGCSGLTELTIGSGVTTISGMAFAQCTSLTSVTIPDSVITIGGSSILNGSVFAGCSGLTDVTIGSGVTSIGTNVFNDCISLTSITCYATTAPTLDLVVFGRLPQNGTLYVPYASDYSSWLAELPSGWSVVEMEPTEYKARLSSNGVNIYVPLNGSSILTSGETAIYGNGCTDILVTSAVTELGEECFNQFSSVTSVTIEEGVQTIGTHSLQYMTSLTDIHLPNSLTTIGEGSLAYNSGLTSITIGSGVTSIGDGAFYQDTNLSTITCLAPTAPTVQGWTFLQVGQNGTLRVPTGSDYSSWTTGPDKLTSWTVEYIKAKLTLTDDSEVYIPYNNSSDFGWADIQQYTSTVVEMDIYPSVTGSITIGGCTNLTTLNLPNSITAITSEAFYGCSSLTSLTIPDSVTVIGDSAFMECSSLTSLTIPSGVTSIDGWCFMSCSSITDIYCYATTAPTIANQTFQDIATGGTLHYPTGSDYSTWMSNEENYLGYYGWTSVGDLEPSEEEPDGPSA